MKPINQRHASANSDLRKKDQGQGNTKKGNIFNLLGRLLFAGILMIALASYVWVLQLKYDEASKAAYWTGRIWMPIYYASAIFGAGVSYDVTKYIFFLKGNTFSRLVTHVTNAIAHAVMVIILMLAATYLLNEPQPGARTAGQVIYLVGLAWLWNFFISAQNAVEVATQGNK